jgi:hypothetical protein
VAEFHRRARRISVLHRCLLNLADGSHSNESACLDRNRTLSVGNLIARFMISCAELSSVGRTPPGSRHIEQALTLAQCRDNRQPCSTGRRQKASEDSHRGGK